MPAVVGPGLSDPDNFSYLADPRSALREGAGSVGGRAFGGVRHRHRLGLVWLGNPSSLVEDDGARSDFGAVGENLENVSHAAKRLWP